MVEQQPAESPPKKIAILGGGMAALAAAFELTSQPGWQGHYEVSVYQMGWRLGGKGASGRNQEQHCRIEEHGLHVWPGFYDNAFSLIRKCYAELAASSRQSLTWDQVFLPQHLVVMEENLKDRWVHWPYHAPPNAAIPGQGGLVPSPWGYVRLMLQSMEDEFHKSGHMTPDVDPGGTAVELEQWPHITPVLSRYLRMELIPAIPFFLRYASRLAQALPEDPALHLAADHDALLWLLGRFSGWLWKRLAGKVALDDSARRLWIVFDLGHANVRGMLRDGVIFHGFDVVDEEDYQSWLRRHQASSLTVDSGLIRGLYDFIFACLQGDPAQPSLAAGAGLRLSLRTFFGYKGAILYRMQSAMGDVVFAPLYQVLKSRGVKFHFFHRVLQLGLSAGGTSVATVRLGRQATLNQGDYSPLIECNGPAWPSNPLYQQLREGNELQTRGVNLESRWTPWADVAEVTLRADEDFDVLVLGISLAALPDICSDLLRVSERWRDMVRHVHTIQTVVSQIWLRPDLAELGWDLPPPVLTAYAEPLETWADMSQTIPSEGWPEGQRPHSAAYFCGPMRDPAHTPAPCDYEFPETELRRARETALHWLEHEVVHLWPRAGTAQHPHGLNPDLVAARFFRANVDPTDRYVTSVAGSTKYRLRADESGFDNLHLAGDWTRTGLNVGCIEAAVISGRQAARAIDGVARHIPGESDF